MQSVLLVEDHAETREWLCGVLSEAFPGCEITTASTFELASNHLTTRRFSLALLDINLPDGSGLDLIPQIISRNSETFIVVSTIYDDDKHVFRAMELGAHGYLLKEQKREKLVEALSGIPEGIPPLSPAIARRIMRHFQRASRHSEHRASINEGAVIDEISLSPREKEVLTFIAKGYSRGEIGRLLGISDNTVAGYVKGVYKKLNVNSRAEAALEAARMGLVNFDGGSSVIPSNSYVRPSR